MCSGVEFQGRQILFSDESPKLPLLLRDGSVEWMQWGKPFAQSADRSAPAGGWARLESIQSGKWKRFGVKPVKIVAQRFMQRDVWYPVPPGFFIQGAAISCPNATLQAEIGAEIVRAYVVTVPAAGDVAAVHDRMPRLVRHLSETHRSG